MSRRTLLVPLLALACTLAPSELSGQVTPVSSVFQISPRNASPTTPGLDPIRRPVLAAVSDGSFVMAWDQSLEAGSLDGLTINIYAQKIHAGGGPGRLVRIDQSDPADPYRFPGWPELAGDGQGGFAVAWDRARLGGVEIFFQHVAPGRFAREGGTLVRPRKDGEWAHEPAVAADATGNWVIAWEEWQDNIGRFRDIGVRAFRASGEPLSAEIRIEAANPAVIFLSPRVAINAEGFMVVWQASGGNRSVLQGRSFALDGTPRSPVFQIGRMPNDDWDVLTDQESGDFFVAWQGPSPRGSLVRLATYTADGLRLGTKALGFSHDLWRIHMNRHGEIAFVRIRSDGRGVLQVMDRFATPKAPPLLINGPQDLYWLGDVAISDTGRILTVWISGKPLIAPGGKVHYPIMGRLWQVGDER